MKRFVTIVQCICLMLFLCSVTMASPDKKKKVSDKDDGETITLVTSGTGNSKEEATKNALRSALEQTYGAFVSPISQVVNDELVRDEIVSISAGNIISYEELSFIDSEPKQVTVKAVVSITKLQNYAQNKGMAAELAGNTFAMNLKIEELNKKNQDVALKHMLEQTRLMTQKLFDYELSVGEPEKTPNGVQIPVAIRIMANKNTVSYYDYFHKTLSSLAVNKGNSINLHGKQGLAIEGFEQFDKNGIVYELRGEPRDPNTHNTIFEICNSIGEAVLNCEIVDNLGNISGFEKKENYSGVTRDYATTNKLSYTYYGGTGRSDQLRGYRNGYKSKFPGGGFLIERLSRAGTSGVYFWLNAVKPVIGEKLYETKLFLMYTADEIAKVSKIEIRPKTGYDMSEGRINVIKALYADMQKVDKYIDLYNSKEAFDDEAKTYLLNAFKLLQKVKSNPNSAGVINPSVVNEYIESISGILRKNGIEL